MSKRNWATVGWGILGALGLAGCGPEKGSNANLIVATTTMVADMARQVVREDVEDLTVVGLMAAGVDPHTYNLPARSIADLKRATVVLYSGLKLEGRTEELYEPLRGGGATVLAVASAVDAKSLITPPGFEGHPDPHVWGDPRLWAECVPAVAEALGTRADPVRAQAYARALGELHQWAAQRMEEIPEANRILITSHDAFNYFGRAYGLEVIGIQGISTESEASMADVSKTADLIRERGIKAIFVESSVNPSAIERIAKDTGIVVGGELYSDSLGPAGQIETVGDETYDVGTYIGMMKHNVNTIVEALK